MDPSKLGTGEKLAGGGALVLAISLFLPWYGVKLKTFEGQGLLSDRVLVGDDGNAWEAFSSIDIVLFLVTLVVLGLVLAKAAAALPALPAPGGLIIASLGGLALLLIVYRLIDVPGPDALDVTPKAGIFIALIGAGAVALGGYRALNEG